jgi:hypothetical protein
VKKSVRSASKYDLFRVEASVGDMLHLPVAAFHVFDAATKQRISGGK